MCSRNIGRLLLALFAATVAVACDRVDQTKFDNVYRAAKAVEVDIDNSSAIRVAESEKLLKQLKTEISLLDGRTNGEAEAAALKAYDAASEAYKSFLAIRDLDLRGDSRDGRMLLGDGWVPVAAKFKFAIEPAPSDPNDKYKFYWVNVGEVVTALLAGVKSNLTEANRLINGQS